MLLRNMDPMTSAVAVLTAMITPAVLISACGSMILSTSHRLGRVVDRVRGLSDKLDELFGKGADETKDRQTISSSNSTSSPAAHASCNGPWLLFIWRWECLSPPAWQLTLSPSYQTGHVTTWCQ